MCPIKKKRESIERGGATRTTVEGETCCAISLTVYAYLMNDCWAHLDAIVLLGRQSTQPDAGPRYTYTSRDTHRDITGSYRAARQKNGLHGYMNCQGQQNIVMRAWGPGRSSSFLLRAGSGGGLGPWRKSEPSSCAHFSSLGYVVIRASRGGWSLVKVGTGSNISFHRGTVLVQGSRTYEGSGFRSSIPQERE